MSALADAIGTQEGDEQVTAMTSTGVDDHIVAFHSAPQPSPGNPSR